MRIGHCQFECRPGDFDANLASVVRGLERARRDRVEIVCFPECFLTGYFDREEPARASAFSVQSSQMRQLLDATRAFDSTFIAGFNEHRGDDLYNTALVARGGTLLGTYSKCFAYMPFHKQGREFPIFERGGVKFGVVICADGGYVEPARILALQGAAIIFVPHYNYIEPAHLLAHFTKVRADHVARAVENSVYFVRGNSVTLAARDGGFSFDGIGYGDSYLLDPAGQIIVASRRHSEDFIFADIDPALAVNNPHRLRSRSSIRELSQHLLRAAAEAEPRMNTDEHRLNEDGR